MLRYLTRCSLCATFLLRLSVDHLLQGDPVPACWTHWSLHPPAAPRWVAGSTRASGPLRSVRACPEREVGVGSLTTQPGTPVAGSRGASARSPRNAGTDRDGASGGRASMQDGGFARSCWECIRRRKTRSPRTYRAVGSHPICGRRRRHPVCGTSPRQPAVPARGRATRGYALDRFASKPARQSGLRSLDRVTSNRSWIGVPVRVAEPFAAGARSWSKCEAISKRRSASCVNAVAFAKASTGGGSAPWRFAAAMRASRSAFAFRESSHVRFHLEKASAISSTRCMRTITSR